MLGREALPRLAEKAASMDGDPGKFDHIVVGLDQDRQVDGEVRQVGMCEARRPAEVQTTQVLDDGLADGQLE